MKPSVSIIIPVYNSEEYLEACLQSVCKQHYSSFEAIVLNDGSTDQSEDIIMKFVNEDNRFSLYTHENHGLGYTRNRGLKLSKSDYVFFLDSDDLLAPDAISSLVAACRDGQVDYAVGKVLRFNQERKYVPIRHLDFHLYNENAVTTLLDNPELIQDSIACNKLWRKAFLNDNALWFEEGKLYEDLFFTAKAAVLAEAIAVTPETVYNWRVREDEMNPSITQEQMKLDNTQDRISALTAIREWMINHAVDERILKQFDLKALLDITRLHALKYALVAPNDRIEWEKLMSASLLFFGKRTSERLPAKEHLLFSLITNRKFTDLLLLSQVLTNVETQRIVKQEDNKFILYGENDQYDLTSELKPVLIVNELKKESQKLIITGDLTLPKASIETNGIIELKSRTGNEIISLQIASSEPLNSEHIYPYENQRITFAIDTVNIFAKLKSRAYDFYYQLSGEDNKYKKARIRLSSSVNSPVQFKKGLMTLSYYRTNMGNLSLVLEDNIFKKAIRRVIKKN